jgi:hypothetical protein
MKIPFWTYLPISVCFNGVLAGGLIAVVALLFQRLIKRRA